MKNFCDECWYYDYGVCNRNNKEVLANDLACEDFRTESCQQYLDEEDD